MTARPARATARRTRRTVRPRCSPGRALYRAITRKASPLKVEELTDVGLLRVLFPEAAALGLAERLEPHGGLRGFISLGERGPRALLEVPGVDEATAARVLVLWEVAARISEPFRTVSEGG
ncbi:hypothetical protein V3W47_18940 [Deinococcus sp. YIM 134068]|uniref:hypothetical protein n=1 Tax=Deinococcus lichenicola TaxID=3118910 RepID=UPI002F9378B0